MIGLFLLNVGFSSFKSEYVVENSLKALFSEALTRNKEEACANHAERFPVWQKSYALLL